MEIFSATFLFVFLLSYSSTIYLQLQVDSHDIVLFPPECLPYILPISGHFLALGEELSLPEVGLSWAQGG